MMLTREPYNTIHLRLPDVDYRKSGRLPAAAVNARNNALGGNVSKHPKTGRYLGPMAECFSRISTVCSTPKNTCACMHAYQGAVKYFNTVM